MFSAENPGDGWSVGNSWQGSFPTENSLEDGYAGLAPATAFAPNALGVRLPHACLRKRSSYRSVSIRYRFARMKVALVCRSVARQFWK